MPKALSKTNIQTPGGLVRTSRDFENVSGGPIWTSRDFEMGSGTGSPDTTEEIIKSKNAQL